MNAPQGFDEWLAQQRTRPDRVGDLARDVAGDKQWPAGAHSEARLNYLVGRDASPDLIEALERAHAEYDRSA